MIDKKKVERGETLKSHPELICWLISTLVAVVAVIMALINLLG